MRRIIVLIIVVIAAFAISRFFPQGDSQVADTQVQSTPSETTAVTDEDQIATADPVVVPAPTDQANDEIREIKLGDGAGFAETMELLGIVDLETRMANWSKSRGYPYSDQSGTYLLEQPYTEYDDDTLRAFAENEDMWAQQFLAERLEKTRPAEALDWYRKAAINGSINAIDRMTALYRKLNRVRVDGTAVDSTLKEQVYAIKDSVESLDEMSFAWSVAAVMAGGDPSRNNLLSERIGRSFDEPTMERACNMAGALYDDMSAARTQRQLGDFDRTPPPFLLGARNDLERTSCNNTPSTSHLDLNQCEEVNVVTNGIGSRLLVCGGS